MTILLLGDSHTDIFLGTGKFSRFDMSQCQSTIFTVRRFTDAGDHDLWSKLEPWFNQQLSDQLVISGGEIDIRAHFWRQLPRNYSSPADIINYVSQIAHSFYQSLDSIATRYQLKNVVVWAPPVAGEKADYNYNVPFSGSSRTRNQLVHIWNKTFIEVIKDDARISLATAYYDFVDPVAYTTVTPNPSHDGVHWHDSFGQSFCENYIMPALSGKGSVVGENWNIMHDNKFTVAETLSHGTQLYDSWIRSDHIKNITDLDRHVNINGNMYSWIRADQKSILPEQYTELSLTVDQG